jgi:hypothetical protein
MPPEGPQRRHPAAGLSDAELEVLAREATDLYMRIANTDPRDIIRVMIEYGCPEDDAKKMISDPLLREGAYRFYFDYLDGAVGGDPEAKERWEFVTESWHKMREGRRLAAAEAAELVEAAE